MAATSRPGTRAVCRRATSWNGAAPSVPPPRRAPPPIPAPRVTAVAPVRPQRPPRPGVPAAIQQAVAELQQDPTDQGVLRRLPAADLRLLHSAIGNRAMAQAASPRPLIGTSRPRHRLRRRGSSRHRAVSRVGLLRAWSSTAAGARTAWDATAQGAQSAWSSTTKGLGRAGRAIGGMFRRRGAKGGGGPDIEIGRPDAPPSGFAPVAAAPPQASGGGAPPAAGSTAWASVQQGAQTAWAATTKALGSAWQATSSAVSTAAGAVAGAFSGGGAGGGGGGGGADFEIGRVDSPQIEIGRPGGQGAPFQGGGAQAAPAESGGEPVPAPDPVEHDAVSPDPVGAAVEAVIDEVAPEARLTLMAYLAQNPPARATGQAPVPGADTDSVKLSSTLQKVASVTTGLPRTLEASHLKAWIGRGAGDGGTPSSRAKQLEALAKRVRTGKAAKGTPVPEQRAQNARNLLLSFVVYGLGSYEQALVIAGRLDRQLGAATYGQLPEDTRGALTAIGFNANIERVGTSGGFDAFGTVGRVGRVASGALSEEEDILRKYLDMTIPAFHELVPESSRSVVGQQVALINRLRARIVWQYEVRNLGPLPALPPLVTEDDPFTRIGEAAEQYRELVNDLRVKSNRVLPAEVAAREGGTAEERAKRQKDVAGLVQRGDLYAKGSGELEQASEARARPERAPFGLAMANDVVVRPGEVLPEGDLDKSELDGQHRAELDHVRDEMRKMLAAKVPTFAVQKFASEMIDLLLKQMHIEALQEMQAAGWGTPPTEYAFLALGSGGRHEATTFGDLDFALVVGSTKTAAQGPGGQKKTSKQYFQELGERMKQKVYGLKERGPTAVLGEKQRKGLRVCEGGVFPASSGQFEYGKMSLIGTVEDLAAIQRKPGFITMGESEFFLGEDAEVFDALREPRFAFGSQGGKDELAAEYEQELSKVMTEKAESGQSRGFEAGKAAINGAREVKLPDPADMDGGTIEIKKIYRAVQLYVKGLCMMVNLQATNSRQRVLKLMAGGQMPPDVGAQVLAALDALGTVRTKAHLTSLEQNDAVLAPGADDTEVEEGTDYVLSDTELATLKQAVAVAIPALAAVAAAALEHPPQQAAPKQAAPKQPGNFEISGPGG